MSSSCFLWCLEVLPLRFSYISPRNTALTGWDLQSQLGLWKKRATLTYWCRARAWPVVLSLINVHLNLQHHLNSQHFPQTRPLCTSTIWLHFGSLENFWLCFILLEERWFLVVHCRCFLMGLLLLCYVKHDVKDVWRECWGGKRKWCTAKPPLHQPLLFFTVNLWFLLNASWAVLHITHHAPGEDHRSQVCSMVCD